LPHILTACLILHATWPSPLAAQQPAAPATAQPAAEGFDTQQLDALLAPIALYPDSLLTQVLMAATFPLQVVETQRWLDNPANKSLTGDALTKALAAQSWDPSVKSLVPFPQVIAQMNANLDWMQQVGYAFTAQQQDVLNSVQRLRDQAQSNGKLQSSPQQTVSTQTDPGGQTAIVIQPAQPNTVYVPVYNPTDVYGAWPYPAYPPVYLPPPPGYVFGTALATGLAFGAGVAIAGGLWGWASPNWGRGNVNVNVNHWNNINVNRQQINSNVWRASNRPGGLPPNLQRPPGGPVGRPAHAGGLPANAIGRPNVSVPGNLVDRPGRQNPGSNIGSGNRPNLSPGSRPNPGAGQGALANRPGNAGGSNVANASRPNVQRPQAGGGGGGAATPRPNVQRPQGGGAASRPNVQRPQGGGGAFGGQNQGQRAQQFGQRGAQSRQGGGGGAQRGGGGGGGARSGGARGGGGGSHGRR
jgi:hypothetical protein